jgi:hypothetical protein
LDGAEPLAYAVLTVSRTIAYAWTGMPHSKRAGACWLRERQPQFRELLDSCEAIWYELKPGEGLSRDGVLEFIDKTVPEAHEELTKRRTAVPEAATVAGEQRRHEIDQSSAARRAEPCR